MQEQIGVGVKFGHRYRFECFDKDGNLKWVEEIDNLVTTEGMNDMLTQYYKGSAYTAAHYLGLAGSGTKAAADTMASHGAWSEVTGYAAGTRPAITWGSVAAASVSATGATSFSINATVTVAGAFISTNSTKGGSTGVLVGVTDFAAPRSLASGDTLNVTPTASLT